MNEVVERLIMELEKVPTEYRDESYNEAIWDVIKYLKGFVRENGVGWISCYERYPETNEYILLSFANFPVPMVGRYEEDTEGGVFYIGDEDETCVSQDMFVNAWMPLPEPYRQ